MKKVQSLWGVVMALLVLLPGCVHVPTYRKQSFKVIEKHYDYCHMQNDVIVQTKRLSKGDMYALFGVRAEQLFGSVEVMYVSVNNLSNDRYVVSVINKDDLLLSHTMIKRLMKTSSAIKVVQGYAFTIGASSVACLLLAPVLLPAASVVIYVGMTPAGPLVVAGLCSVVLGGYLAFAFGPSIKSICMNRRMSKDLQEKILYDPVTINSGQHYEGLIFVKKADHPSHFDIVMCAKDMNDKDLTFNVKIPSFC
jgi:hypothetical protein